MENQKYLLPIGFYDLLGVEAKVNQETIDILLSSFYAKNYQLIKTPLVEFEESLIDNKKFNHKSFKTIDSFSGKTLVFRSDITPQIARLLATRLQNSEMPLRLCYVGDVLKIKTENLYADRQLTQAGIELIGDESCAANLEVIELTLLALKKIKLANLMINFCWPQFFDILFSSLNLENKEDLAIAIKNKNISAIKNLARNFADELIYLVLQNQDFDKISSVINSLPISEQTQQQLQDWQKTISDVKKHHPEVAFSVDIFGDGEFSYHHQIGFTIFADGFSYPIARGGRYIINQGHNSADNLTNKSTGIPAIGSTIYISNLRKILIK